MKVFRFGLVVMAAALITFGLTGAASAFHSGGVAECVGCHSMHDPASASNLLVASDPSSTCLSCHESTSGGSYHISTADSVLTAGVPPLNLTPGGDFAWLKKDYTWNPGWAPQSEEGDSHGHNIVATDNGYAVDGTNTTSPGGSFTSANLACISCHDPHGTYRRLGDGTIATTGAATKGSGSYGDQPVTGSYAVGVYRLLGGDNYEPQSGITFSGNPAAVTPSSYNRSEATTQTRTAYGLGVAATGGANWGDWCATCHADMHTNTPGAIVHPVDQNLGTDASGVYNAYRGSGSMGGTSTDSFLSLVPFVQNTADYTTLAANAKNDDSALGGPGSSDKVSCLSCHRAHASGWKHALRWNTEIELIVVNGFWPGTDSADPEAQAAKWAQGRTVAETTAANGGYAAATFGTYQRSLCNKCHGKD